MGYWRCNYKQAPEHDLQELSRYSFVQCSRVIFVKFPVSVWLTCAIRFRKHSDGLIADLLMSMFTVPQYGEQVLNTPLLLILYDA
jgi:hypothetical protein